MVKRVGGLVFGLAALVAQGLAEVRLAGRVTSENNSPVSGARVRLQKPDGVWVEMASDTAGAFECRLAAAGDYRIAAERDGYFRLGERPLWLAEGANEVELALTPLREVFEAIDVRAVSSIVDLERVVSEQSLSGAELLAVPFPASNSLKNALRVVPGVVQDAKGNVHLNGGTEEQVLFTLNGFTLNDPLNGRFEARVGVEAVQTVDIANGRLPAEYGRGSAGMVAVTTSPGDDKPRYSATNFFPGFENRKGFFLGNWSPRLGLSGPIRKGRAWFSDSLSTQYDQQVIEELPSGGDRMSAWRVANLLHTQVNLTPSQILHTGLLVNGWTAPRFGLSVLSPPETTLDRRTRQWFFNIKDQIYLRRGALVEFGYAANRTFAREVPQGHAFLSITPDGNRGNAFADAVRKAGRDQWLASFISPSFGGWGTHQLKTGIDVSRLSYWQLVRRTGFEQLRADGSRLRRVLFGGRSEFQESDLETASFVQDTWRVSRGVLVELGLRLDWDRLIRRWNLSPRTGVAWVPGRLGRTKIHGAYALVYEAASLRLFTRPLDQYALTTYYAPDGAAARGPAASVFRIGAWRRETPRARNWSAGFEREATETLFVRVNYLRRRGENGFTYTNRLGPDEMAPSGLAPAREFGASAFDAVYMLGNERRDSFDSIEVALRQSIRRQYGWMASYTRSRALSNGVVDINIDDPIMVLQNVGPMPWDSPHRFVGWTYLPLFWRDWAVAAFTETRSGLPFSVQSGGRILGEVNSRRLPAFFELNLHLERRFAFRGHRWEFRMGFNNITNHRNPNLVNSDADSRNFLRCYGGQGRAGNFRIRWLGRVAR
ncbi:MAG: TonB-dependent receptor [Acidobacteria bacterium]|nr:TonB-dependent receptor [Acidobacteriota bacterium]